MAGHAKLHVLCLRGKAVEETHQIIKRISVRKRIVDQDERVDKRSALIPKTKNRVSDVPMIARNNVAVLLRLENVVNFDSLPCVRIAGDSHVVLFGKGCIDRVQRVKPVLWQNHPRFGRIAGAEYRKLFRRESRHVPLITNFIAEFPVEFMGKRVEFGKQHAVLAVLREHRF